ncbi:MAG: peptide ABC transporter substrate-binding protein [Alphaproteobacteria bacterium]|nr:peptide ABC transporter substrate-binding protein [Alphaproteobacteria bacterium]MCY4231509.1 peptide ABC transporter substrate-binding protein [Alphaproteobacteria bacterium]
MIRAFVVAVLLCLATALSAGAKERLVIGMTQFPSTLHPLIDSMLAKSYALALGMRPFTAYDPEWQLVCMLCIELPTVENGGAVRERTPGGQEGIAVTYTIRPDARWGDGMPVTTKDVAFAVEVGKHPQSGVAAASLFQRILELEIHDDRRFTLHLDRVTFDYNDIGGLVLPAHLDRANFEADPAEYRRRTAFDADSTNPGLWFGPYRIIRIEPGTAIEFARNPTWWGHPPAFETIIIRIVENTAALEVNLRSGAIDYIAGELGLSLDQAAAMEQREGDVWHFVYKAGLVYEHIDLNLDNPVLADIRVRRALLHAIDRETISKRLFFGRQPVAHGLVSPLDRVYDPALPRTPFDPDTARNLLDEAGWTNDRPGALRRNAAGEPLRFEFGTTAGNRSRELVQQVLQAAWKDVGIDVRIRNQPARVFFGETVSKRRFPGLAMYAWLSSPESVPRSTLHSTMIPTAENNWSGQNYTGYRNLDVDRLLDSIETELNREARRKLWAELQASYARDLPVLPLYFRATPYVFPKPLKSVTPTGHLYPTTLWIEQWRWEE